MPHALFSSEEIVTRGEDLYERDIRPQVEVNENIGKIISIDIETGDYAIDADPLIAGRRLQANHPDAAIYGRRIGYNAVYAVGGTLVRDCPMSRCVIGWQAVDSDDDLCAHAMQVRELFC